MNRRIAWRTSWYLLSIEPAPRAAIESEASMSSSRSTGVRSAFRLCSAHTGPVPGGVSVAGGASAPPTSKLGASNPGLVAPPPRPPPPLPPAPPAGPGWAPLTWASLQAAVRATASQQAAVRVEQARGRRGAGLARLMRNVLPQIAGHRAAPVSTRDVPPGGSRGYDGPVKDVVTRIARLLESEDVDRQLAAALVLGELAVKDAGVAGALIRALGSPVAALQQRAVQALAATTPRKALTAILPLVESRDAGVRAAAADAVVAYGEDAVAAVRERLAAAAPPGRRPWEELLGRLGGQHALPTLLASLGPDDLEGARTAVLALRPGLKAGDDRVRRRALDQARAFLKGKAAAASPAARLAAVKVMGYAEHPDAAPALLDIAGRARERPEIREEAVIGLRLTLGAGAARGAKLTAAVAALVQLAEKGPPAVARAALYSLVGLSLTPAQVKRVGKLAVHAESERALIAIGLMGRTPGAASAAALAAVLVHTGERARAEAAAEALGDRPEAAAALAEALIETEDHDRAEMFARLLRPQLGKLGRPLGRRLIERAAALVEAGSPAADPVVHLAGTLDAPATAAALRALATRLRKGRKPEQALRVLRTLGRSREAAAEDGFQLAALELTHGRKDQALIVLAQLADTGFDVASALRKDRALDDRHRYDVGFHFVEREHPLGEEVLSDVARAAGRTKLAQMARAKLKSAGLT
jgi:hypothetical protein